MCGPDRVSLSQLTDAFVCKFIWDWEKYIYVPDFPLSICLIGAVYNAVAVSVIFFFFFCFPLF